MDSLEHNFAIPLWALVDQAKVETGKSDLRGLAKELGKWLAHNFDVDHKGVAIEEPSGTESGALPMFVVAGVPQRQWHVMVALAQSRECQLFVVLPAEGGAFRLQELNIPKLEG
ncbi:MAG: hypothetical protein WCP67_04180 [Verrucomicrobiota bacterium]|jgi:hypothetical protein